jgi:DNA-binding MarR family transcriptional regulator
VTQTNLAKKAGLDRPNLTRILGRLEKKGFVERKPNPDDHRSYIIQLTKTGREAKAPLISIVEAHLNEVVMGMSQKEYDAGIRFLRIVIDNLRHVKNGG